MRKIFVLQDKDTQSDSISTWARELATAFKHETDSISADKNTSADDFAKHLEDEDASLLIIELNDKKHIQQYLNLCRGLRVPYLFIRPQQAFRIEKISLPITFLVEDKEKIPFASAFGRFCNSNITIYKPKDYGDKAQETINQAQTLFDSFSLQYTIHQANKGSYDVESEAAIAAVGDNVDMVIISASREYGLDDIIFGSKEKKILKTAQAPILLINPRADLYALCD